MGVVARMVPRILVVWIVMLVATVSSSHAHEMRPTIIDVAFGDGKSIALSLSANAEAMLAGIGPEHDTTDAAPHGIDVPPVGDTATARQTTIRLTGTAPAGEVLDWRFDPALGASVLRLSNAGEEEPFDAAYILAGDTASLPLGAVVQPRGAMQAVMEYIPIGFAHIVPKGLDHILFVIGLFLLSTRMGPLLWQVTTFTLAHSVTLALAALGIVTVSPAIVEPLIAASIVFIAVENMMTDRLGRGRLLTVFLFGLLHGLGFAGVLAEIGLPPGQFISGLIGFNIGVEIGQLAVILACYLAVGLWFSHKPWYRRWIVFPASTAIALIAAYWFIERVGLLG